MTQPAVGSKWSHAPNPTFPTPTMVYTVLGTTTQAPGYPAAVLYQGANGKLWYKRLADQWPGSLQAATIINRTF